MRCNRFNNYEKNHYQRCSSRSEGFSHTCLIRHECQKGQGRQLGLPGEC